MSVKEVQPGASRQCSIILETKKLQRWVVSVVIQSLHPSDQGYVAKFNLSPLVNLFASIDAHGYYLFPLVSKLSEHEAAVRPFVNKFCTISTETRKQRGTAFVKKILHSLVTERL